MMTLPLDDLQYGHEADPPINSRRSAREEGIEALAAMIQARGLLTPLLVQNQHGRYYVADGNRRLAALRLLAERMAAAGISDGLVEHLLQVRVELLPETTNALEVSQMSNVAHLPPHPADQYETFSVLAKTMTAADIAARFGIEAKSVSRMLALGDLSPVILDAWRTDALHYGVVKAFTLAPSIEEQDRVFRELSANRQLHEWAIKRAFGADRNGVGHLLPYIGEEAYAAAGGSLRRDLFGEDHVLSDPALVRRLADEKLQADCQKVTEKGWGWAASIDSLPAGAEFNWQRQKGGVKKASRASYGCMLRVKADGALEILEGYVRPEDRKALKAAAEKAEREALKLERDAAIARGEEPPHPDPGMELEKKPAIISNMLAERLSQQLTLAVQECVANDAFLALAAITAGLQAGGGYPSPVRITCDGYQPERPVRAAFDDAFDALAGMEMEQLLKAFCHAARPAIDLVTHNNARKGFEGEGQQALVGQIAAESLLPALRQAFHAEDYFKSAPKALVLQAIAEGINPDEARKVAGKPVSEIKAFAIANIDTKGEFGWLPLELRTRHYDGPVSPKVGVASPRTDEDADAATGTGLTAGEPSPADVATGENPTRADATAAAIEAGIKPLKPKRKAKSAATTVDEVVA